MRAALPASIEKVLSFSTLAEKEYIGRSIPGSFACSMNTGNNNSKISLNFKVGFIVILRSGKITIVSLVGLEGYVLQNVYN